MASDYFNATGAQTSYPTGHGGSTTTAGSSMFASSPDGQKYLVLFSAHITSTSGAGVLSILPHTGATPIANLSVVGGVAGDTVTVNFGPKGLELSNGIRVIQTGANSSSTIVFADARPIP